MRRANFPESLPQWHFALTPFGTMTSIVSIANRSERVGRNSVDGPRLGRTVILHPLGREFQVRRYATPIRSDSTSHCGAAGSARVAQ